MYAHHQDEGLRKADCIGSCVAPQRKPLFPNVWGCLGPGHYLILLL